MNINQFVTNQIPSNQPLSHSHWAIDLGAANRLSTSSIQPAYIPSISTTKEVPVVRHTPFNGEKITGFGLLAITSLIIIAKVFNIKELLKHSPSSGKTKLVKRIPCTDCDYFSDNFYLKCAIHPQEALTEQAVDCRDFCLKQKGRVRQTIEK